MSKFVNAVMVGLVSFLVLLSVFWYFIGDQTGEGVTIEDVRTTWGATGANGTDIDVSARVLNPRSQAAQLVRLEHEAVLNEESLGRSIGQETVRVPAKGQARLEFKERIPADAVADWFAQHVRNGEKSTFVLRGTAEFTVGKERVAIPFRHNVTWSNNLAAAVGDSLKNCPEAEPLCVDDGSASWDLGTSMPSLKVAFKAKNGGDANTTIRNATIDVALGGVVIATAGRQSDVAIGPDEEEWVEINAPIDDDRVDAWWGPHVGACESSQVNVTLRFTRVTEAVDEHGNVTRTDIIAVTWSFVGGAYRTQFVCRDV